MKNRCFFNLLSPFMIWVIMPFCISLSFAALSDICLFPISTGNSSTIHLHKLIQQVICCFSLLLYECQILQSLFLHCAPQKFQLSFSDPKLQVSFLFLFSLKLPCYSHVLSMVFSASFCRSLLFICEEIIQSSLPYRKIDIKQQFSNLFFILNKNFPDS